MFVYLGLLIFLASLLVGLQWILSIKNNYFEKLLPFECGFLGYHQTRVPFSLSFYLIGLLFLLFDLEILFIYPYSVSWIWTGYYGLSILVLFICVLFLGFLYEINKGALKLR